MSNESKAVAIDLGTTFSVVAHVNRDNRPETVSNDVGEISTPSVVFFDHDGPIVGSEAMAAAELEPGRVAQFAKRDMGSELYTGDILGSRFPPEVIQAIILKKLKNDAELRIGNFDNAVITVPAYFNEPRRKATQDSGALAGLNVIDIINEPTAAAIAYGVRQGFLDDQGQSKRKERVLVYDLGGGTFDVTLMDIEKDRFTAIATGGDVHLGGMDWDQRLVGFLAEQFQSITNVDIKTDLATKEQLRQHALRAKKTLSARQEATVRLAHDSKQAQLKITRTEFQELTADLTERTRLTVQRLLKDASTTWSDVTQLILVGGSTRMPMIAEMLEQESGMTVDRSLSPDEAVAHGAATYAKILLDRNEANKSGLAIPKISITNVCSHDLGVLGIDPKSKSPKRQVMIPKNSQVPIRTRRRFVTSKEDQKEVVVTVVEGGTETGEGASKIGKCHVSQLPKKLAKGAPVYVTFEYGCDGRLAVAAELPDSDCVAKTTIERASGMDELEMMEWKIKIDAGILINPKPKDAETLKHPFVSEGKKKTIENENLATKLGKQNSISEIEIQKIDSVSVLGESAPSEEDSRLAEFLTPRESQILAGNTNVEIPDFAEPGAQAGESILDVLDSDTSAEKADDGDSALNDFLKGLE